MSLRISPQTGAPQGGLSCPSGNSPSGNPPRLCYAPPTTMSLRGGLCPTWQSPGRTCRSATLEQTFCREIATSPSAPRNDTKFYEFRVGGRFMNSPYNDEKHRFFFLPYGRIYDRLFEENLYTSGDPSCVFFSTAKNSSTKTPSAP